MFDKIKDMLGGGSGGSDLGDLSLGGLEKYLDGVTYPIGIDDLMNVFKNNGAPAQLQGILQSVSFHDREDNLLETRGLPTRPFDRGGALSSGRWSMDLPACASHRCSRSRATSSGQARTPASQSALR